MKVFAAFLLLPLMALAGWLLSQWSALPEGISKPSLAPLEAPPALGVVIPAQSDQGPVRVRVDALLPPTGSRAAPGQVFAVEPPQVTAILVEGRHKVAQVNGQALGVGERSGQYRIAAIESQRVLFEHPALRDKRWVSVTE